MAQYEMNLREYWRIIRRRRGIILTSTILVALFALWFAWQREPVYRTTAAIKFERSTTLTGILVEVLSFSPGDTIETQAAIIRSFPVMEQVAKRLGGLPENLSPAMVKDSKEYTRIVAALTAKVKTSRVASTNIIEITTVGSTPRRAKDLANTVAEVYREYQGRIRNARIVEARQFIEQQLRELEGRIKEAEEELSKFRRTNQVITPGAESTILLSLFTQIRGEIERTRQQRSELELVASRLRRPDGAAAQLRERVYVETPNPAIARLQASLADLLLERNNLALEVTDDHPRLQAINDRIREIRSEMLRQIIAQIALLKSREDILNRQIGELFARTRAVPTVELSLKRMERDAKVNDDLLALLKTRHQEALIKEAEKIQEVTIIRPAIEPAAPVGREVFNTVVVGLVIGLILGLVLAFVQETLDTSIGTIEDVEEYLEVPVLGVIPHIDSREVVDRLIQQRPALASVDSRSLSRHALLVSHFDPKSPVAEAFRSLRTRLQFAARERPGKVFVLTSPSLQEGKTTTIVNLAIAFSQAGARTLLVGANLRRPSIYRFFGIERDPGLTDALLGSSRWEECVRTVADMLMGRFDMEDVMSAPGLDNLHILESGPIPANPSELLGTPQMAEFLHEAGQRYDIVLVDAPPVLPVTDATILGAQVDGVILVYQAGKVGRLALRRAKIQLEAAQARVWGVVLNDLGAEIAGYAPYTHYYTHYYGEESAEEKARPARRSLGDRVGGALSRLWTSKPEKAPTKGVEKAVETRKPAAPARRRARRWIEFAVLLLLVLVLGVLVAWRFGFLALPTIEPIKGLLGRAPLELPAEAKNPVPTVAAALERASPAAAEPATELGAPIPTSSPSAAASAQETAVGQVSGPPELRVEPRYALEFGPFVMSDEAERVERRLNTAGLPTVRFRQELGGDLYGVFVESLSDMAEAQAAMSRLRAEGFSQAVLLRGSESLVLRVGEIVPLRPAVRVAQRLRAAGYSVRIAAQPGEAVNLTIRHGSFASEREARVRSDDLVRQGVSSRVVRVK